MQKHHNRLILKFLFSLSLIALILSFIDLREMIDVITNLNPLYLLAVIILLYIDRILMAYKWNLLLQAIDVQAPFSILFKIYVIAPLFGSLLPSSMGGDIFRLYSLSRYQFNINAILASIVVERVIGFVAMLILSILSLGLVSYLMKDRWVYSSEIIWIIIMGITIIIGLIGIIHNYFRKITSKKMGNFRDHWIIKKISGLYLSFCEYRKHLNTVMSVIILTFIEQIVPILIIALMALALHINVSLLEMIAIVPLIILAIRLPIPLDIVGVQEGLYVALFGLVGISVSEAFVLSTLGRVILMSCALPWGIHYIITWRQTAIFEQQITSSKAI